MDDNENSNQIHRSFEATFTMVIFYHHMLILDQKITEANYCQKAIWKKRKTFKERWVCSSNVLK